MVTHLPVISVVTPLLATFAVFVTGWWSRRFAYPLVLAALSICLASGAAVFASVMEHGPIRYWIGGWSPPFGIEYRVDALSAFMLLLISFTAWITALYGRKSVAKEMPDKVSLFWSLYLLLITGLSGISVTGDLFNMFVLLEVSSLTGYTLVAMGSGRALMASFRYLVIGTVGACFYLLGVGYLYIVTGTLNMEDMRMLLPALYGSPAVEAAFVFVFIGFSIKMALFPLHAWQPDAYTYAPSAVTVIISTAAAKTFVYALIRVVYSVFTARFLAGFGNALEIIVWIAAAAMLAGSVFAIAQNNLKRMLAYSSVANVGYIMMAVGLAPSTSLGLTPAVMHVLNHAVIKGAMFMAACNFIYRYDIVDIRRFTGLGLRMPYTCLALILAALAMIGMPPGAGFVTKWYLIRACLETRHWVFVGVIFLSTLLMIVYFWRVIETMYIKPDETPDPALLVAGTEAPPSMLLPALGMALLTFAVGLGWISGILSPWLQAVNTGFGLGGG